MLGVPADVENYVFPSVVIEIVVDDVLGVVHDNLFVCGTVVAVPRVPSHRRSHCPCTESCDIFVLRIGAEREACNQGKRSKFFKQFGFHIITERKC